MTRLLIVLYYVYRTFLSQRDELKEAREEFKKSREEQEKQTRILKIETKIGIRSHLNSAHMYNKTILEEIKAENKEKREQLVSNLSDVMESNNKTFIQVFSKALEMLDNEIARQETEMVASIELMNDLAIDIAKYEQELNEIK